MWAGQYKTALWKNSPIEQMSAFDVKQNIFWAQNFGMGEAVWPAQTIKQMSHHHSHAAAGYYTSAYKDATVVVIDSIGEWETLTIWSGKNREINRVFSQKYPHSVGLWYSAMTQRIGLKPNEDEYILMGWAALGDPDKYYRKIMDDFLEPLSKENPNIRFRHNLHRGCLWWAPELNTLQDYADIAAATQKVYETLFRHTLKHAMQLNKSKNLVLMGGCALNCVANSIAHEYYENVWIMPNPGDAGSSLGCIAAHQNSHINWKHPFLGHNIEGEYPVDAIIKELKENKMVGVANGRAEFGPRALGNRSLLADPRGEDIKDLVNGIKRRQKFRPFAPAILEEDVNDYFDLPKGVLNTPYMQYTAAYTHGKGCPAILHHDGTSRVQTVSKTDNEGFYELLKAWKKETGCPILLNTSLNIKGQPMVNDRYDADMWTHQYKVKVL